MGIRRSAIAAAGIGLLVAVVLAGCAESGQPAGGTTATQPGVEAQDLSTPVTGNGPAPREEGAENGAGGTGSTSSPATGGAATEGWQTPPEEITRAFQRLKGRVGDRPVYAPTLLPPGSTLAQEAAGQEGEARARVIIQTPQGTVEFLEVIEGDLGDLPSTALVLQDGRQAAAYHLLAGILVQWSEEGALYGVYSSKLSTEELASLAGVTKPL